MVKNYKTKTIFEIKKVVFAQLIMGTFMIGTSYAENSNKGLLKDYPSFEINNSNIANSKNTVEEFKNENTNLIVVEKITGIVVDEQGVSLPGVNVFKKGTKTGVSTDLDGNFIIEANKGDVLVFSYLGFINQEIQIRDNKILKIVLKSEAQQMNEVVVVGYGSQKKTNLTGSVTQIDSKVL